MIDNAAFAARLGVIVDAYDPLDGCPDQALALFDAHTAELYRELDIHPAARPTTTAKLVADCALNDLRLRLLRAELAATGPAAALLATLRHRVDMCRRALAMHMTSDDGTALPIVGFYEWSADRIAPQADPPAAPAPSSSVAPARGVFARFRPILAAHVARQRERLKQMRVVASLHDRELINRSIGAIGRSMADRTAARAQASSVIAAKR